MKRFDNSSGASDILPSTPDRYIVRFSGDERPWVSLDHGSILSEHLTVENSPILFGCRTGICGTCLIEVLHQDERGIAAPSEDELEVLELMAPGNKKARLACCLALTASITIRPLD